MGWLTEKGKRKVREMEDNKIYELETRCSNADEFPLLWDEPVDYCIHDTTICDHSCVGCKYGIAEDET